LQKLL